MWVFFHSRRWVRIARKPQCWLYSQIRRTWPIYFCISSTQAQLPCPSSVTRMNCGNGSYWSQRASSIGTDGHIYLSDGEALTVPLGRMWQRWLAVPWSSCSPFYSTVCPWELATQLGLNLPALLVSRYGHVTVSCYWNVHGGDVCYFLATAIKKHVCFLHVLSFLLYWLDADD